jgi:hypothetical protein
MFMYHQISYGAHSGEKKENGPSDLEKRDGVGWEEKEALEREAKTRAGDEDDKQGIRVVRFGGNTPLISGMGASEVYIYDTPCLFVMYVVYSILHFLIDKELNESHPCSI